VYLDCCDEVLGISLELPFALFQLIRAGCNDTPGSDWSLGDITVEFCVNEQYLSENGGILTR
jgi:hypothetical protein